MKRIQNGKKISIVLLTFFPTSFATACSNNNLTMSCLGDSITGGYNENFVGNRMPRPYPDLCLTMLDIKRVDNLSDCGLLLTNFDKDDCISSRYSRVPQNTSIISILGGTNDYLFGSPLGNINDVLPNTVYGALNFLSEKLISKFPNAFIFYMTPMKVLCKTGPNDQNYELFDVVNAIKDVGNKYKITVLDTYSMCDTTNDLSRKDSDKLHVSQEFISEVLTPKIVNFIQNHL